MEATFAQRTGASDTSRDDCRASMPRIAPLLGGAIAPVFSPERIQAWSTSLMIREVGSEEDQRQLAGQEWSEGHALHRSDVMDDHLANLLLFFVGELFIARHRQARQRDL